MGRYDREDKTVGLMRKFATANGMAFSGNHHEIYLSDPNRTAPERLRTIPRNPVRAANG